MAQCPGTFPCPKNLVSFDIGPVPSYVAIVSSSFSCLGSLLILVAYFVLKDMRTGAQKIITLLAMADLFSALGYIVGSINFLVHFNKDDDNTCKTFQMLCESQAIITSWSSLCSFAWTFILAFHFFMVTVLKRVSLASKLIPLYNVIAWGGPLLIVVPLAMLGKLGYAPYAASNWCFVKDNNWYSSNLEQDGETVVIVFLAGKLWEILTYISVTVLFIGIAAHVSWSRRQLQDFTGQPKNNVEKRLLAIPLLFILLRIWGTLQFFYSLAVASQNHGGCIPSTVRNAFMIIGVLQAIGDGGQGWGNAILYVFLSPTIRQKLFTDPCEKCLGAAENRVALLLETETETNDSEVRGSNRSSPATTKASGYKVKRYTSKRDSTDDSCSSNHKIAPATTNSAV